MSGWTFRSEPPADWSAACAAAGSLFHDRPWLGHLERSFGCATLYGGEEGGGRRSTVSVFRAGPFRVGYLAFPVGGLLAPDAAAPLELDALAAARLPLAADLLRVPVGSREPAPRGGPPPAVAPETVIADLPGWDPARRPNLLRDLKKAARSGLRIEDARDPGGGEAFHRLYAGTVRRRGGRPRYGPEYFASLIRLCGETRALRCLAAVGDAGLAGFCVVALHRGSGYYLHGAVAPAARALGVSDLLLGRALEWSREQGMSAFNLMTSPPGQAGLVRYKEKWGGVTNEHRTFELPLRPWRARLFRAAAWLHDRLAPRAREGA